MSLLIGFSIADDDIWLVLVMFKRCSAVVLSWPVLAVEIEYLPMLFYLVTFFFEATNIPELVEAAESLRLLKSLPLYPEFE